MRVLTMKPFSVRLKKILMVVILFCGMAEIMTFLFIKPDLTIAVADPHRAGHELSYYPGEVIFRISDVVVINKMDTAAPENIQIVQAEYQK